jgi:hypothetical protein
VQFTRKLLFYPKPYLSLGGYMKKNNGGRLVLAGICLLAVTFCGFLLMLETPETGYKPPVYGTPVITGGSQPLTTPAQTQCQSMYVVEKGDTLSQIANSHGLKTSELRQANTWITDPNFIVVGDTLCIPSVMPMPGTGIQP